MFKLVGNFNSHRFFQNVLLLIFLAIGISARAQSPASENILFPKAKFSIESAERWSDIEAHYLQIEDEEKTAGLSYIISGGLAVVGGVVGSNITSDPLERGVYALFQTIGVASIGYGAHRRSVGNEQRLLFRTMRESRDLSDRQKLAFAKSYETLRLQRDKDERAIRAITHGLIAVLNFYNASQQEPGGVKNTILFVGTANLLASLSYSF